MAKKIYDIKPPKVARKKAEEHKVRIKRKEIIEEPKVIAYRPEIKKQTVRTNQEVHSSSRRPIFIGVVVVALLVGVYLFFTLPKATVTIWPKVDILSFKQTITASKLADSVNIANATIPAQYFQASKTESQNFPATGNASNEGRSSGNITVYNKISPATPFTLKTGTHFMSDSGVIFIASQKIVIPAAQTSGGKTTPGSVQVKVQAVDGGTGGNIAPSAFVVPGLKGTSYYYSIYATSSTAMTGGYSGAVKKVTDDDIQGAKDILTKKATASATAALKSQISSDYVIFDSAVMSSVSSASTQTKSGTIAPNFNYQVSVTASTLVVNKSDLDQLAKNYIISQMPEGKTILDSSFKLDYTATLTDVSGGKATIVLNFSSGVYQEIDKNSMALSMLGENYDQIKATINSTLGDQASKVQIKFWPFWVNSAPNNQNAVNVELKFQ